MKPRPLTEREKKQLDVIFELPESKHACPICGVKLLINGGDHLFHPFPTECALAGWGPNEKQWSCLTRQIKDRTKDTRKPEECEAYATCDKVISRDNVSLVRCCPCAAFQAKGKKK